MQAQAAAERDDWRSPALGAIKGLLGLIWAFSPEIIGGVVGVVVGLILGAVSGAGLTASLFDGGGAWGRAGIIALIIPAFTFLGPILVGGIIGATTGPSIVLAVHAVAILLLSKDRGSTRRLVVLSTALAVLAPALLFGLAYDSFAKGCMIGMLLFPITGAVGLVGGASYAGARATLAGRSIGQWWSDADGSMGVAMLTTTLVAWLGTWIPMLIFVSFPVVFGALAIAIVLGTRLFIAGSRRRLVGTILLVNLLHAAFFIWVIAGMEPPPAGS